MMSSMPYIIIDALEHGIGVFGLVDLRWPLRHHGPRSSPPSRWSEDLDLGPPDLGYGHSVLWTYDGYIPPSSTPLLHTLSSGIGTTLYTVYHHPMMCTISIPAVLRYEVSPPGV